MNALDLNLVKTLCAICETDSYDKVIYASNFNSQSLSFDVFSARRLPDGCHYRVVQCQKCGLIRSNPILDENELAHLYAGSHFNYERESSFAAQTYASYLKKIFKHGNTDIKLLEIGCGNGTFLSMARAMGIKEVCGVEPSQEAVENSGDLRSCIRVGMFKPGIYPENHFDVICAFQVFDHISQPNLFLNQCRQYLRNGGLALFINHDIGSLLSKVLGERCPMVDIEHTYLYDKATFRKIFEKNNFQAIEVFSVNNCYPISYWCKLAPFPRGLKEKLINQIQNSIFGRIPLTLSLGNIGILARAVKN